MELLSSFGPLGSHKIISNGAGTVTVSKDAHNALRTSNESTLRTFAQIARSSRIAASNRRDDGFFTSEIIVNSILDSTSQRLFFIQPSQRHKWRVRQLAAALAIRSVVQSPKEEIHKCLVDGSIWHVEHDCVKRLRAVCHTMTLPASNAVTANVLDSILEKWVLSTVTAPEEIRSVCRSLQSTFVTLVKHSLHPAQSSSQEKYILMPRDRIILTGRCWEYTSLARPASTATKVLCVRNISYQRDAHAPTTLQAPSAAAYLTSAEGYHAVLRNLIEAIKNSVDVEDRVAVLVAGSVTEEEADLLSSADIVLMDCVSMEELEYTAARCGCVLYDDPSHAYAAAAGTAQTAASLPGGSLRCGQFSHLERALLGDRNELHYILCGVSAPSEEDVGGTARTLPQVVLLGTSALQVGVYANLLRRCLGVMIYSLEEEHRRGEPAGQAAVEAMTVVPGGGAGELSWALLWEKVSAALQTEPAQASVGPAAVEDSHNAGVEARMSSLASTIAGAILQRLGTRSPEAVVSCRQLCDAISAAYMQVPRQLVRSAAGLVDCCAATKGHSRDQQVLLEWRKRIEEGSAAGRVGIIVNRDPDSMEICAFADAIESGVYTSLHHFRDVFHEALEQLIMYLRVNGDDGVIMVRRCKPVTQTPGPTASDED